MPNHPNCVGYIRTHKQNIADWNISYPGNPIYTQTWDEMDTRLTGANCDDVLPIYPTSPFIGPPSPRPVPKPSYPEIAFHAVSYEVGLISELLDLYPAQPFNFFLATKPADGSLPTTKYDILVNVGNDWYDLSDQYTNLQAIFSAQFIEKLFVEARPIRQLAQNDRTSKSRAANLEEMQNVLRLMEDDDPARLEDKCADCKGTADRRRQNKNDWTLVARLNTHYRAGLMAVIYSSPVVVVDPIVGGIVPFVEWQPVKYPSCLFIDLLCQGVQYVEIWKAIRKSDNKHDLLVVDDRGEYYDLSDYFFPGEG